MGWGGEVIELVSGWLGWLGWLGEWLIKKMDAKIYFMPQAILALTDDGLNTLIKPGDFIFFNQFNDLKYVSTESFTRWLNLHFEFRMINKSLKDPVWSFLVTAVKDVDWK